RLVGEPDIGEQRAAPLADRGGGEMRTVTGIDRVEQWDPQIVHEIEAAERLWQLKAAGEPQSGAPVSGHAVDGVPIKHRAPAVVMQCAGEAVDERALARAVGPDQAEPLTGGDGDIDVFEGDKAAEALAQPAALEDCSWEDRGGHQRSLGRRRLCTKPTMPLGAMTTKTISRTPTISRLSAEGIVTVASCWIVPSNTAPITGPSQLVMPPIIGIATLL